MEMALTRRRFCGGLAAGMAALRPVALEAAPRQPKLLIFLILEQFRPDYLDRLGASLAAGGFRRLMKEAAFFPDCRYVSSTFPAAALATLATGAYPELHGVIADRWYDRSARQPVPARASALEATTFADEIPADGSHRIFAIGMREDHVALLAGRSPAQVIATDVHGVFAARGEPPAWLADFNRAHPLDDLHDGKWMAVGAAPKAPPLRTLGFNPAHPEEFLALYRASPFAQTAEFDLLRELVIREKLGQGDTTDFVLMAAGAISQLGYEVGADSPLMNQMVLHADLELQQTLDALDKLPGAQSYALVVAGAHGAPPEPDPNQRAKMALAGEAVARALNNGLADRLDIGTIRGVYIQKYVYPFLYLNADAFRKHDLDPRRARQLAGEAALGVGGVAGYYTADGDCSYGGAWRERFRNSFHAARSGDVMLSYLPDYVEEFGAGRGISYGSFYNYDARVPLFFYGPPFRAGVIEREVQPIDVAPTLARVAGMALPSSATGRVLAEALAEPPAAGS